MIRFVYKMRSRGLHGPYRGIAFLDKKPTGAVAECGRSKKDTWLLYGDNHTLPDEFGENGSGTLPDRCKGFYKWNGKKVISYPIGREVSSL